MNKILLEGGPTINSSFFKENFVDKFMLFQVPLLGNSGDKSVFGEINMKELIYENVEVLDDKQTLLLTYRVKK